MLFFYLCFRGCGSFFLVFDMQDKLERTVHNGDNSRHNYGEAEQVVAPILSEPVKRVAFIRFCKEHIVRAHKLVENIYGYCHTDKYEKAFEYVFCAGLYIAAEGEHNGVERKEDMYGEAVDGHKVCHRKLRPGGEEERHHSRRNAHHIKEVADELRGLYRVERDDENVYRAELKGKIVFRPKSRGKEHYPFCRFVKEDERRYGNAEALSSLLAAFAVAVAANESGERKDRKPD